MNNHLIKSRMLYSYLHDPSAIIGSLILVVFITPRFWHPGSPHMTRMTWKSVSRAFSDPSGLDGRRDGAVSPGDR